MLVRKDSHDHFYKLQAEMLLHGIKIVSYGDCFEYMPQYFRDLVAQICRRRSPGKSPKLLLNDNYFNGAKCFNEVTENID